ncbi:MAG: hypothetical protein K0U30_00165 [Actinomycetia bacterium]|nr:hypothetical protein [Actinomycetes bacterium]
MATQFVVHTRSEISPSGRVSRVVMQGRPLREDLGAALVIQVLNGIAEINNGW